MPATAHARDSARDCARWLASVGLLAALASSVTVMGQTLVANPSRDQLESMVAPSPPPLGALRRAWNLLAADNAAASVALLRAYVLQHPDSGAAHEELGFALFRQVQIEARQAPAGSVYESADARQQRTRHAAALASLAEYTAAARRKKPTAFDLKIVALDYVMLHDYLDADRRMSESLLLDSGDGPAWYFLGRIKYGENRFGDAVAAFDHALALRPRSVRVMNNLGLAYEGLDRSDYAAAAYRTAISWEGARPSDPEPFVNLGRLLLQRNQPLAAVAYLRHGVAIAPREYRAHQQLGQAYRRLQRLPEAQQELQAAVRLEPDNAALHYLLGQIYRQRGLLAEARVEFARTTALNGTQSSDGAGKGRKE